MATLAPKGLHDAVPLLPGAERGRGDPHHPRDGPDAVRGDFRHDRLSHTAVQGAEIKRKSVKVWAARYLARISHISRNLLTFTREGVTSSLARRSGPGKGDGAIDRGAAFDRTGQGHPPGRGAGHEQRQSELDEVLEAAVEHGGAILVDLSELTFMDSTGISAFLRAAVSLQGARMPRPARRTASGFGGCWTSCGSTDRSRTSTRDPRCRARLAERLRTRTTRRSRRSIEAGAQLEPDPLTGTLGFDAPRRRDRFDGTDPSHPCPSSVSAGRRRTADRDPRPRSGGARP